MSTDLSRACLYGDALFETLLVVSGKVRYWTLHWQRLSRGMARLSYQPLVEAEVYAQVLTCVNQADVVVVRLMVTRSGARGYRILPNMPSELVLQVSPLPVRWQGQCIVARWCQTRWAQQPLLAGIKHANRLEQVLARSEWTDAAIAEGLVCDTAGHVISGTMSSLMVRQGKRILVANLNQCGIDSVARQLAMAALKDLGYSLEVVRLSIDVVHEADEVLLMNVVQGVAAVRQLADRVYPDPVLLPLLLPLFDLP